MTLRPGAAPSRATAVSLVLALCLAACGGSDGDDDLAGETGRAPRPVPEAGVQVGEETDESVIRAASTPVIAANPKDARNYVVGHRVELPAFSCVVAASFDAGATWATTTPALPAGTERCYSTSLGFDGSGVLHLAFVTLAGAGNVPSAAWLTRSADGGRTFDPPRRVLDAQKFMVRLVVDPTTSPARLYLSWVEGSGVGFLQMVPPARVMMRVSTDGGLTFGEPVQVSGTSRDRIGAAVPALAGDGAVTVVYFDYRRDAFDFQNVEGRYDGTFELVAATSRDGGATFSETTVEPAVVPPEPFLVFLPPLPAVAADRDGTVHVAWSDRRSETPAILLSTSRDAGTTWQPPRRVDDGGGAALLPQIGLGPDGRLDVVYARVEDAEGGPTHIRFTASTDGGRTFGPAAPLNEPFLRAWLPVSPREAAGAGPDLGSALGLISLADGAYVAWPDTRLGGPQTRRTDIVGARVKVTADGAARRLPDA